LVACGGVQDEPQCVVQNVLQDGVRLRDDQHVLRGVLQGVIHHLSWEHDEQYPLVPKHELVSQDFIVSSLRLGIVESYQLDFLV